MTSVVLTRLDLLPRPHGGARMAEFYPWRVKIADAVDIEGLGKAFEFLRSMGPRASQFAPRLITKPFPYPTARRWDMYDVVYFKQQDDAALFKLFWG